MKHETIKVQHGPAGVGRSGLLCVSLVFALAFAFSLWFLDAYYYGDNIFYRRFYNALYQLPIDFWAASQGAHLGSSEPLYRYVIGAGAYYGFDRVTYLSIWNALLCAIISYAVLKYRSSAIFIALLFSNYYLLVLLGSAERLKFAYIFLILAFICDNIKVRFAFAALSPFFHTQAMVQFASGIGYFVTDNIRKFVATPLKTLALLLVTAIGIIAIIYVFISSVGQSIEYKSDIYSEQSSGLLEAMQWTLLLIGGMIVFDRKLPYLVSMLPMGLLTVFYGNRVNIATLFLFAALAMSERKTTNPVVLAVMAYMSFKSIGFMMNVLQYGDGFVD